MSSTTFDMASLLPQVPDLSSPAAVASFLQLESVALLLLSIAVLSLAYNTLLTSDYTQAYSPESSDVSPPAAAAETTSLPTISKTAATAEDRQLIAMDGLWYDVTTFKKVHPGGSVIDRFIGVDATCSFYGMHVDPYAILAKRKPVGKVDWTDFPDATRRQKINREYLELHRKFRDMGFFQPTWKMQARYIGGLAVHIAITVAAFVLFPKNWLVNGIMVGMILNTSGFLTHDSAHNVMDPKRRKHVNHNLAWLFGNVGLGVNSTWWREEHDVHHAVPNTFTVEEASIDPQMLEDVWVQSERLFQFFNPAIFKHILQFQHIYLLPICLFIGRTGIMIDCYRLERRPRELFGLVCHISWLVGIMSLATNPFLTYAVAQSFQGLLSLQLISNHYHKPWKELAESVDDTSFAERQIEVNTNISCHPVNDWFFGGLHFHNEHHFFPKMGREYLRVVSKDLRKYCDENELPYASDSFGTVLGHVVMHFKHMGKLYTETAKKAALDLKSE